jgi:MFS family permease
MNNPGLTLAARLELMGLLFLHGMALASWFVPLGSVLDEAGLSSIKPLAFAASAMAAMLSPLFFGAMADRSVPPTKVLRWISAATAIILGLLAWSIQHDVPAWAIWLMIQMQSIFCSPTSSLAGSIVFSRLGSSQQKFGSIRALGTIGWIAGCLTTSLFALDTSPKAFYVSAILWGVVAVYTLILPQANVVVSITQRLSLRERFGFDALQLLRNHDHRVVFITSALVAIPFAAFYPYSPRLLADLGLERISAWMSLGQVSEVLALLAISAILHRWSFKRIVVAGIALGVLRYVLYSSNMAMPVLFGLSLHGVAFTFTYISTQIYLAERIEPGWQVRAQALLSLMTGGIGNLAGYLSTGVWMELCRTNGSVNWSIYWGGLSAVVFGVMVYFAISYKGQDRPE